MADKEIGVRLTAEDGVSPKVKNIKQELKEAQAEVIKLAAKFGDTSKEAAAAAKKAAELKDRIGDAKSLVDAFNPDTKMRAFGASIQTVVGGFTALTGAMGLLGVESEEVQKTLLKVQSALALSQGVAQLQEGIQGFKNLGAVLGKGGIYGIAIAGAVAIGAKLLGLLDGQSAKARELANSMKELAKGTASATKEVYEVRNAFKQAEAGIITKKQATDKYNETLGKTVGFAKDYNEAEKLTAENANAYIEVQGLKAQANYILGKSSEIAANAAIAEQKAGEYKNAPAFIREAFENSLAKQKNDAADLLELVNTINAKIVTASANFKTPDDTPLPGRITGSPQKDAELDSEKIFQREWDNIQFVAAQNSAAMDEQKAAAKAKEEASDLASLQLAGDNATQKIDLERSVTDNKTIQVGIRNNLNDLDAEHTKATMQFIANQAEIYSNILGKHTVAGKVLAIASATINTWLAASQALKEDYKAYGPAAQFVRVATVISVIAMGLKQVSNIVKVKVPGASGGGSGGSAPSQASVAPPLAVARPQGQTTQLDQQSLNAIGNATSRAFVVESDIQNNRDRITRINRQARIG